MKPIPSRPLRKVIRRLKEADGAVVGGLVGVPSNQFQHAVDIGRQFRDTAAFRCSSSAAPVPRAASPCCRDTPAGNRFGARARHLDLCPGRRPKGASTQSCQRHQPAQAGAALQSGVERNAQPIEAPRWGCCPRRSCTRWRAPTAVLTMGEATRSDASFYAIINIQGHDSRRRTPDDLKAIIMTMRRRTSTGSSSLTTTEHATRD